MKLKSLLSLSTGALSLLPSLNTKAAETPNIILFMADDIGHECYGVNGSTQYKTPNINKLAEESVYFEHCYSNPVCTPSRNKIMTGLSNVRNYSEFLHMHPTAAGHDTFAHMLKSAGYKTCVAGKWQLAGVKKSGYKGTMPAAAGFDETYCWYVKQADYNNRYWEPKFEENGEYIHYPKDKYGPDILSDRVNNFITRNKKESFFVYYPMLLTHAPFVPTPDSKDKNCTDNQKNFEDMVSYMDKMIGKVISHLDKEGLRENTLILITGDNGTHKKITSTLNGRTIRGGKGQTTDAGTHVALLAHWKGRTKGKRIKDIVDFGDFYATLADAAEIKISEERKVDSISFLPQIIGQEGEKRKSIYVCNYGASRTPKIFARNQRYKLYSNGKMFDIQNDIGEKSQVTSPELKSVREMLQKKIDSMPKASPYVPSRNVGSSEGDGHEDGDKRSKKSKKKNKKNKKN